MCSRGPTRICPGRDQPASRLAQIEHIPRIPTLPTTTMTMEVRPTKESNHQRQNRPTL